MPLAYLGIRFYSCSTFCHSKCIHLSVLFTSATACWPVSILFLPHFSWPHSFHSADPAQHPFILLCIRSSFQLSIILSILQHIINLLTAWLSASLQVSICPFVCLFTRRPDGLGSIRWRQILSARWVMSSPSRPVHPPTRLRVFISVCPATGMFISCCRLTELHLSLNNFMTVDVPNGKPFPKVTELYINENQFVAWEEISKLGKLFPALRSLVMIGNPLARLDGDDPGLCFESLESLNISNAKLESWDELKKLTSFTSLVDIRALGIPFFEVRTLSHAFSWVVFVWAPVTVDAISSCFFDIWLIFILLIV